VKTQIFKAGAVMDLLALGRAALARTGPAFPAAKPPLPSVPKGTLVIGGGGGLSDDVYRRFIAAAGGATEHFVVLPTANPDPLPAKTYDVERLKKLGVQNVKALPGRMRTQVDSKEYLDAVRQAKGVWFGGGRQWRFVDAYQGTQFEKELHAVLERGGAIGGSSAGASIQADYMCRGDPLGNLNIIAEGYERGLGFIQGVAIDQHFFKRKRTQDMTELMKAFPQILGIGIDENTAVIVRGDIMEVVGKSNVAVYDRTRPANGERDYELLPSGSRYNVKLRKTEK
jgi:cyanophycinase